MSADTGHEAAAREHQLFWMLVKKARRRDDVARVYLAVQAAIAYRQEAVDVGWLMGSMMAEGQKAMDAAGVPIGASGLAYFWWLYEVDLDAASETDCHDYRFRRRHDGAQVQVRLRTAETPRSLQFQQEYERERRSLERKRAALLPLYVAEGNRFPD